MRVNLSGKARRIIKNYNHNIVNGSYNLEEVDCLCGGTNKMPFSLYDRYGFWHRTVLCEQCGLIYANPRPTKEVIFDMYSNGNYREVYGPVKKVEKAYQDHLDNSAYILMDVFESLEGRIADFDTVFEFGCGGGWNLENFRSMGMKVSGCDLDPNMIDMGVKRGFDLEVGSFEVMGSKNFDIIILNHVVEHFFNFWDDMKRIIGSLGSNGILYVAAPNSLVYNPGRMQNVHNYYFKISNLRYFMSMLGFEAINYGHMFNFQDFFCVFERADCSAMSALYSEKENFKEFLVKIGK